MFSRLRAWTGERSRSNTIKLAPSRWAERAISCTFPLPMTVWGWARGRFCKMVSMTSPPAVSTSRPSSSMRSRNSRSEISSVWSPTRMARSRSPSTWRATNSRRNSSSKPPTNSTKSQVSSSSKSKDGRIAVPATGLPSKIGLTSSGEGKGTAFSPSKESSRSEIKWATWVVVI